MDVIHVKPNQEATITVKQGDGKTKHHEKETVMKVIGGTAVDGKEKNGKKGKGKKKNKKKPRLDTTLREKSGEITMRFDSSKFRLEGVKAETPHKVPKAKVHTKEEKVAIKAEKEVKKEKHKIKSVSVAKRLLGFSFTGK